MRVDDCVLLLVMTLISAGSGHVVSPPTPAVPSVYPSDEFCNCCCFFIIIVIITVIVFTIVIIISIIAITVIVDVIIVVFAF